MTTADITVQTAAGDWAGAAVDAIRFEGVRKRFGQVAVLRGITGRVGQGEVVVICGPSGSGKTTLLRCINRLEAIDGGQVYVFGQPVHHPRTDVNRLRSQIGMVFQQFNLFPHLTVLENLTLAPVQVKRLPRAEAEATARRLLERVGIPEKAPAYPAQLSGGQQQRVAIARAVISRPSLLLADEPTGNVDDGIGVRLMYLFEELNKMGTTVVIATHNEGLVGRFSHRQLRIGNGTVRLVDPGAQQRTEQQTEQQTEQTYQAGEPALSDSGSAATPHGAVDSISADSGGEQEVMG